MIKIKLKDMVLLLNVIQETRNMNKDDEIPADFRVMTNRLVSLTHQEAIAWNNLDPADRLLVADVEIEVAVDKVDHLPPFIPKTAGAQVLQNIYTGKVAPPEATEIEKALQKLKNKSAKK